MGLCLLRDLYMLGVLGCAQRSVVVLLYRTQLIERLRSPHFVCQVDHHGQMERSREAKDEGVFTLNAEWAGLIFQLGGNEQFKSFMESYGADGGYTKGMGMQEKYHTWAAAQYRDKVCHIPFDDIA